MYTPGLRSPCHRLTVSTQGEENLGMAMTFTLVSHLRERLTNLARSNEAEKARLEVEKERKLIEVDHRNSYHLPSALTSECRQKRRERRAHL